jgi:hypothetical protein
MALNGSMNDDNIKATNQSIEQTMCVRDLEQNKAIFESVVKVANTSQNRVEESLGNSHSRPEHAQPVVKDITDLMDVHALHTSLRVNDACLERMFKRAEAAMERASKTMRYVKRRQTMGTKAMNTGDRTVRNACCRSLESSGSRMVENTDSDGSRVENTTAPLQGKPRLCWQ